MSVEYLAGLLEGEAAMNLGRRGGRRAVEWLWQLTLNMTDREPVEWVAGLWGTKVQEMPRDPPGQMLYRAQAGREAALEWLPRIIPLLLSKRRRRQAELVLKMVETMTSDRRPTPLAVLKYRNWLWEEYERLMDRG